MGKREHYFGAVLESALGPMLPKRNEPDFKNSFFNDEIQRVYESLGGILIDYPTPRQHWKPDFTFESSIVELDEERHFNRFRNMTLQSSVYDNLSSLNVKKYMTLCKRYEAKCLKSASWGGNWENPSTNKQFGDSDPEGYLGDKGSSRWKQRAFYDYLKDVSALITGIPVLRFSIWEQDESGYCLNDLIKNEQRAAILRHVKMRIKHE